MFSRLGTKVGPFIRTRLVRLPFIRGLGTKAGPFIRILLVRIYLGVDIEAKMLSIYLLSTKARVSLRFI